MQRNEILVITNDANSLEPIARTLAREGYRVQSAEGVNGHDLRQALQRRPILTIVDTTLSDEDGLATCRALRGQLSPAEVSIVFLAKAATEEMILRAFAAGADDVIPPPYRPKILLARIRAILRRRLREAESTFNLATTKKPSVLIVDVERHQIYVRGAPLSLTLAEYHLLATLVSRPGYVFSREQLIEKISGGDSEVTDRNVDVHVKMVRKKLDADRDLIQTVRGVGYKYRDA